MVDRVTSVFVLRSDGAALLQHRDDKPGLRHAGIWGPPGGHAKLGESMLDCARRELREETDYDASDLRRLFSFDGTDEYGTAYRVTYFWCWYDGIQSVACHEGQALAFIVRAKAENYPIPTYLLNVWDAALAAAGSIIEKVHL